jgi:hypothetical protein
MFSRTAKIWFLGLCLIFYNLIPSTYRTPSYSATDFEAFRWPRERQQGWLSFSMLRGSTDVGYDKNADPGPLFCGLGSAGFAELAKNYNYLQQFPLTKNFIETVCLNENYSVTERNALFCGGQAEILDVTMLASVPMGASFSGFLEIPVRFTKLSQLKFVTQAGQETQFAQLVNSNIEAVLAEQGVESLTKTTFLDGVSDITISLGWAEKYKDREKKNPVAGLGLAIRGGFILPTSTIIGSSKNYLYNLPLGNNGVFGVRMQADAQIKFRPYFCVLGTVDSKIYLNKQETIRLKVAASMQGVTFGPPGYVIYDCGHEWKVGLALRVGSPKIGTFAFVGYTYDSKELTRLEVTDLERSKATEFVVYKDTADLTVATLGTAATEKVKFTDSVLNTDPSLDRQYTHAVHLGVQISPKILQQAAVATEPGPNPVVEVAYHYPVFGKNYIAMPFVSGSISFGVKINF